MCIAVSAFVLIVIALLMLHPYAGRRLNATFIGPMIFFQR
jgi:hypothetical protein